MRGPRDLMNDELPAAVVVSPRARFLWLLVVSLLAKQASAGQAEELATLPSCAKSYFSKSCLLSDTACICRVDASEGSDEIILAACTLPEALFTNQITKTACQVIVRDRSAQFNAMMITLGTLAAVIVGIRLAFKQFYMPKMRFGADDWIVLTAVPIGITTIILTMTGLTAHGLGKDLWGVSQSDLKIFGIYFYAIQILYVFLMAQLKLSLCFFYLKIFDGTNVRRLLWGTIAFHIAFSAAFIIAIVFQCEPIRYHWDKFDFHDGPLRGSSCVNVNAAGWANGAITVASDFWLLAIPLSQVRKLKLHWKKKLGAALMFLTGAIVTIISFLRLRSIVQFASTANPTWDLWGIVWWSSIELCIGFICTCLPTMRLILLRIAPRFFGADYHSIRLAGNSPQPRQPEPPLCSGHTLASLRPSQESKVITTVSHGS